MSTRWFGEHTGNLKPGATLRRLVGDVSRLLDRLEPGMVAPGSARVDRDAAAVVVPCRGIPGSSLVLQVVEWSSSVGCWWSPGTDPRAGPATAELFAEFPLEPDGPRQAVAWLERELRRPVVERVRRFGVARRLGWSVVMDDGYELPVRHRWAPGWRDPAPDGVLRGQRWLLGAAVAAAAAHLALNLLGPELGGSWLRPAAVVLDVLAFAALLAWFGVAGLDRPPRVRVPLLAGLLLATLGQALEIIEGPTGLASPTASVAEAVGLFLRGSLPSLVGLAALACYLAAVLALPARAQRPSWPWVLPVAVGLGWGLDLAAGLAWLAPVASPEGGGPVLTWYGALGSVTRGVALGLAVVLLFVVLERRRAMARRPALAGLAGAVALVLAWSALVQLAVSLGAPLLPTAPGSLVLGAAFGLGWFAGSALVAVAAAAPPAVRAAAPVQRRRRPLAAGTPGGGA